MEKAKQINRKISADDRVAAQKLRSLWDAWKKKTTLSQETAAGRLGMTQAAFSQYLHAKIALNTDATLKFAKFFGVSPTSIRVEREFPGLTIEQPRSAYDGDLSDEALDIARAWQALPPHRRRCFRDSLFLDAAVAKHFPWLHVGKPDGNYDAFEDRLAKAAKSVQL